MKKFIIIFSGIFIGMFIISLAVRGDFDEDWLRIGNRKITDTLWVDGATYLGDAATDTTWVKYLYAYDSNITGGTTVTEDTVYGWGFTNKDSVTAFTDTVRFQKGIWITNGMRLWGIDATGADTFYIYDDGDTTRFDSDNPIKIGPGSIVITETEAILPDTIYLSDDLKMYSGDFGGANMAGVWWDVYTPAPYNDTLYTWFEYARTANDTLFELWLQANVVAINVNQKATYNYGVDDFYPTGYENLGKSTNKWKRGYVDTVIAKEYWGMDASGADSFWIYDDGDTTRFNSNNPIKVGTASIVIKADTLFVTYLHADGSNIAGANADSVYGWGFFQRDSSDTVTGKPVFTNDVYLGDAAADTTFFKLLYYDANNYFKANELTAWEVHSKGGNFIADASGGYAKINNYRLSGADMTFLHATLADSVRDYLFKTAKSSYMVLTNMAWSETDNMLEMNYEHLKMKAGTDSVVITPTEIWLPDTVKSKPVFADTITLKNAVMMDDITFWYSTYDMYKPISFIKVPYVYANAWFSNPHAAATYMRIYPSQASSKFVLFMRTETYPYFFTHTAGDTVDTCIAINDQRMAFKNGMVPSLSYVAPTTPRVGDMYVDTSGKDTSRIYLGTGWVDFAVEP